MNVGPQARRFGLAWFVLGTAVFIYLKTFILPDNPIYASDNAPVFLLDAMRMHEGQVMYRDFFELTLPGLPLVYRALFRFFGLRAWIPSVALVALGTGLVSTSVMISRHVLKGASAFLPGLLFLTFAFSNALDATHHWFSVLPAMAALAVVIEKRSFKRLAVAGILCGVAALFTQSRGSMVLGAFAFYCLWECHRKGLGWRWLFKAELALGTTFLVVVMPVVVYFGKKAGWDHFLYCTFSFVRHYYSAFGRNNLYAYMVDIPEFTSWLALPAWPIWLLLHGLAPLVFLLFFARYWQRAKAQPEEPWDRLMLICLVGLFGFLTIAGSPTWLRICTASMPALILFVWFINAQGKFHRAAKGLLWVFALAVLVGESWLGQTSWHGIIETPAGRVAMLDEQRYKETQWVMGRTRPSDYFLEAGRTDLYFLLGLRDPAEMPFLTPSGYTRPEQVSRLLRALNNDHVRYVLWSVDLDLPNPRERDEDHLGPLRAYLRDNYRVVKTFADGSPVWQKE